MKASRRKAYRKSLASFMMVMLWGYGFLASLPVLAGPQDGVIATGVATINQFGAVTNINQSTDKASINWQAFNIKPNETVNFHQPGISSITLNRVIGNEGSVLEGALNANGKVFLINSNGLLFAKGSSINTAGFVGSTLNITDEDFNAANYIFKDKGPTGSVINLGTITAKDGGYVSLLGNSVLNQGIITATKGTVVMAGGNAITLDFNGNSLVSVTVDEGTLNSLVENNQAVYADGGIIIMTAKAANDLITSQVNNSGIIQARTISDLKGSIELTAQGGTAIVNGTLDASAPVSGDGGFIETSGSHVKIADNAVITTKAAEGKSGNWVIDPDGFTISADADMSGAALTNALTKNSVTIASTSGSGADGNINVNEAVSWSANTLTLNATKNVYVNNVMTATGTAGFTANYGAGANADGTPMGLYTYQGATYGSYPSFLGKVNFSGAGKVLMNGTEYTVINDIAGLVNARSNPGGNYVLGSDFDVASSKWSATLDGGTAFTGNFNGLGHRLLNFQTTATSLFGIVGSTGVVSNLGIAGASVGASKSSTRTSAGILADINQGSLLNNLVGGSLTITDNSNKTSNVQNAGGLVGLNSGLIAQNYVSSRLTGVTKNTGGLVGLNEVGGRIIDSGVRSGSSMDGSTYAGTEIGYVGGLVGINNGNIARSYADMPIKLTGTTDATSIAGAFAGKNSGIIDQSYSTLTTGGSIFQAPRFGGFVGENTGTISNAYTTSLYMNEVSNALTQKLADWTAGFAYKNSGTIKNAYATSYSTNNKQTRHGFVYDNTGGTIENAYWYSKTIDGASAPADSAAGVSQLDAAQSAVFANYKGFDANIWGASKSGYPVLRNIAAYVNTNVSTGVPAYGSTTSDATTLNLSAVGLQGGGGMYSLVDSINNFTAGNSSDYIDAGTHNAATVISSPVYSNIKGTVTVNPKKLAIVGIVADKTYDGATAATLNKGVAKSGLSGLLGNQTLTISYSNPKFADKNAGISKEATVDFTVSDGAYGGKASNYTIANTTSATIKPKQVSGSVTASDKVYDGTTGAAVSSYKLSGVLAGDDLSIASTATFNDKNVGQDKTVTAELALAGADKDNYVLKSSSAQTKAAITQRPLILAGAKLADGNASISTDNLAAMNAVGGDTVGLSGTAKLASAAEGVQQITNLTALTVDNPNYTLVGSVGSVAVGGHNLKLDNVASGTAAIASKGNTTTITTSDKAVIDWLRFSIASNETVNFDQPAASSIVLNRITGNETSVIAGTMNANGRVFIVNSNGILFTANSTVNAGGLVASTLQMSNENFGNGNYVFAAANSGSVVAKGDIFIVDGGFAALAGNNSVSQTRTISVPGGDALLVAADKLTLNLDPANNTLAGYTIADPKGTATAGGALNVAKDGGTGGLIELAGNNAVLADNATIDTGINGTLSWSLPSISIGSEGNFSGDYVNSNLGQRNLSLNALKNDLTINSKIDWASDSVLTLGAKNNININKSITATGENAGLAMNYGNDYNILTPATYSGAVFDSNGNPIAKKAPAGTEYASITLSGTNASLKINGNKYKLIHNMNELDAADYIDGVTRMYYNPKTGAYDTSIDSTKQGSVSYSTDLYDPEGSWNMFNPATGAYDIPISQVIGDTEYYYNPETKAYDLTDWYGGNIDRWYFNPASQKYDLVNFDIASGKYYDLATATYSLTKRYNGKVRNYIYDIAAGMYDKADYDAASGKYFDPSTGGYTSSSRITIDALYFNPTTGYFDIFSPYAIAGNYALANDVSASGASLVAAPIRSFSGTFTGLGHTVNNLNITASNLESNIGLIGQANSGSVIRDIGVVDANIATKSNPDNTAVGALVGRVSSGTVSHAYSTGSVGWGSPKVAWGVGGLIGVTEQAANGPLTLVSDSYSAASVTDASTSTGGIYSGGGLIGRTSKTTVLRTHATGDVHGTRTNSTIGGLIGRAQGTSVTDSYATGAVGDYDSTSGAGGLIGAAEAINGYNSNIRNSFATGNVTGIANLGGLIAGVGGSKNAGIAIDNSYATGNVTANASKQAGYNPSIGGLIASASYATISNSHADGNVTVTNGIMFDFAGGLVGDISNSTIFNSYANGDVTGVTQMYGSNLGAHPTMTGGLVGHGADTIVNKSYSTGDVSGGGMVGGIGGGLDGGSIIDSYASGTQTGVGDKFSLGGVTGYVITPEDGGPQTTFDSVYWNSDSSGNAFGNRLNPGNFSTGLAGNQFADIPYYVDHTIDQVIAGREAAAAATAAKKAAFEASASSQGGHTAGQTLQRRTDSSIETNAITLSGQNRNPSVDDHIVYEDSGSYSASIKAIGADGVEYKLDEEDSKRKKD